MERWSPAVHALLRHLETKQFAGAPRFLGVDDRGREILSYIDGSGCRRPWVPALRTEDGLAALIGLVKDFHCAVSSFRPSVDAEWVDGRKALDPGQVVCHRDLGPWNTIWRNGQPVAFIDWDFAGPADPLDDLAYIAFFCVPLRDDDHCRECGFDFTPDRRSRLRLVCEAYGGGATPSDLWRRAEHHQEVDIAEIEEFGPQGLHPWAGFHARDLHTTARVLLRWLLEHRSFAS
jgi:phosphotransferase family enzyme